MANPTATQFQCATDAAFATLVKSYDGTYITTLLTAAGELPKGQTLYARVRHQDSVVGWTPWSATKTFSIANYQKWVAYLAGMNLFEACCMSPSGHIYAVGGYQANVANGQQYAYYLVSKWNPDGTCVWKKFSTNQKGSLGWNGLYGCTTDSSGNLYAVGAYLDSTGATYGNPYIMKWSSDGTLLWKKYYPYGYIGATFLKITADAQDNLYVTAQFWTSGSTIGTGILKFDTAGTLLWQKYLVFGAATLSSLVVDNVNNVLYCIAGSGLDQILIKCTFTGDLTFSWAKHCGPFYVYGYFFGVTMGPSGTVYTVGCGGANSHVLVAKWAPDGTMLWIREMNVGGRLYRVVADASGNVYAAGYTGYNSAPYIVKFDINGNLIWQKYLTGAAGEFHDIAISTNGNIYVAGFTTVGGTQAALLCAISPDGSGTGVIGGMSTFSWVGGTYEVIVPSFAPESLAVSIGNLNWSEVIPTGVATYDISTAPVKAAY